MESDQRVTVEDLSSRWAAIKQKLTDEIRPDVLRKALCRPWFAAALGIAVGTGVGYLLARRSVPSPQGAPERLPAKPDRPEQFPNSPRLVDRVAVSVLELSTRALLARMPPDPGAKLTKKCH
ncbi:MAG: hypothetical protein HPY44_05420 [Armatimonadetes bacterium]|nr:hypothetical protein [Armatimonadota bacterium]